MTELEDFHKRVPKHITVSGFVLAMLLDFIPFSFHTFFWLPEFTALILLYWALYRPQMVGVGTAFIAGLLVDVGTAAPLGQHALSYMVMVFFVQQRQQRIMLFSYGVQAMAIWAALLCNQVVLSLVRLMYDHRFTGWQVFIAPFIGALLWPLLSKIMLVILNSRLLRR
ncbi:rod shape-determining protein MreD [Neisseria montereyensis]|uniref:Rod shape-determining protein MreD n=1 Tax=Neisseria montereyensis TaxID=2973938 RepID=A0ABT2FC02_9NEIS|nr:rod shape-determining protein MreD [Neisseria montereyensis]MCS4533043.1 rod shape-determining protein MreD [Neisseria montereyensis]